MKKYGVYNVFSNGSYEIIEYGYFKKAIYDNLKDAKEARKWFISKGRRNVIIKEVICD